MNNIIEWLNGEDTGMSSRFMVAVLTGTKWVDDFDAQPHPHDVSDFGRCYRMLNAIPQFKNDLDKLKPYGDVWPKLIDNWDEMTRLYERDRSIGRCPELYKLMKELGA